ncbi:PEGA domain-containing protein [Pseudoalteromonas sp. NEC-BIFX-2020_015]|uniref:PEGA domain-containing protein n=1 Tax=Pseudoalteromonas sp. NEC-BIFX-2020_015 TaxID=2729544 RepID=UPI001461619E|nr:PEGA domain-containing protein [Pseudoalteromonas sp. NEC-BIFX-2020_015]NMR26362.1 PEGA domain-containing protein [Pseudoalteromonas sp. NEC-BIFX-2020_015]
MKKLSVLAAILMLSGCATSSKVEQPQKPIEQPTPVVEETISPISLTVITSPEDALIRIMNIRPKYKAGIELDEGEYDVEVSKDGYLTYRRWITIDKKTILTIELDEIEASQTAL